MVEEPATMGCTSLYSLLHLLELITQLSCTSVELKGQVCFSTKFLKYSSPTEQIPAAAEANNVLVTPAFS